MSAMQAETLAIIERDEFGNTRTLEQVQDAKHTFLLMVKWHYKSQSTSVQESTQVLPTHPTSEKQHRHLLESECID